MRCANCPLEAGEDCLAEDGNEAYAWMCRDATAGPSQMNTHIVAVCRATREARAEAPEGPGFFQMAANFAGAVMQHAREGFRHAPPEVQEQRLAICRANTCGFYGEGDRCLHSGCGCFLTTKIDWADQSCPLDPPLWGPVEAEESD